MKRLNRNQVLVCILSLTLSMMLPWSAMAADGERAHSSFIVTPDLIQGNKTVRASGEIRIEVAQTLTDRQGNAYRVSLAFANESDYETAKADSLESLDLNRLESYVLRPSSGESKSFRGSGKAGSFSSVLTQAESALCGDTILRGFTKLPSGVQMGVNLHAAPGRIKPHKVSIGKNTLPGDCNIDVFEDCDTFAAFGCGGPDCVWSCRIGGFVVVGSGLCLEEEIFGPNTCLCT